MAGEKDAEAMSDEEFERRVKEMANEIVDALVANAQRRSRERNARLIAELEEIIGTSEALIAERERTGDESA